MEALTSLLVPPGMALWSSAALVVLSFATSLIAVAFGIGGGTLLLAVMAMLVPAPALIATHGAVQLASNLGRAAVTFGHVHWPALPAFLTGTAFGAAIGGAVAVELPGAAVQIGVGLFVAWSALFRPPAALGRRPLAVGAASSFLTMFFGATGPFVATYVKALRLDRLAHTATHATLMTAQHGLKLATFGLLGFAFAPWAGLVGAMAAAGFAGTLAGRRLLIGMGDAAFARALNAVLLALAAQLVLGGPWRLSQ